jgi:predicted AAA+ superfamily ATPase
LVRDLAQRSGKDLIEINLEKDPGLAKHFASNDPARIIAELSLVLNREIIPERSLLFLDEIQAAGKLLASLRWFYEAIPALPLIAAGSLLEFTFADHDIRMPVGRVSFLHIEPLSFREYAAAHAVERMLDALDAWRPGQPFSPALHEQATRHLQRYLMVGGMPAVVAAEVAGREPRILRDMQKELVAAYRADFPRYRGRMDGDVLHHALQAVVRSLGAKFVYARVGEGVQQQQAKRALKLLAMARVVHLVTWSAGTGLPLGASTKDNFRKAMLVDIGLAHALLGTPAMAAFPPWDSLAAALRGQLIDQLAGQELRARDDGVGDGPELFYWQREGGSPGEIDYLIQSGLRIIPIELKAGAAGSMRSLHQFMLEKGLTLAVRCDSNPPSMMDVAVKTTRGDPVSYRLLSVPPYLLGQVDRLLSAM